MISLGLKRDTWVYLATYIPCSKQDRIDKIDRMGIRALRRNFRAPCERVCGSRAVKRPRVRRGKGDGPTEEVHLQTYESARQLDQLHEMVLRALSAGVSGREMGDVRPKSPCGRR